MKRMGYLKNAHAHIVQIANKEQNLSHIEIGHKEYKA